MGTIQIEEVRCKGCGLCTVACSRKLITLSDSINNAGYTPAVFTATGACTGCALCAEMCPDVAISVFREEK